MSLWYHFECQRTFYYGFRVNLDQLSMIVWINIRQILARKIISTFNYYYCQSCRVLSACERIIALLVDNILKVILEIRNKKKQRERKEWESRYRHGENFFLCGWGKLWRNYLKPTTSCFSRVYAIRSIRAIRTKHKVCTCKRFPVDYSNIRVIPNISNLVYWIHKACAFQSCFSERFFNKIVIVNIRLS